MDYILPFDFLYSGKWGEKESPQWEAMNICPFIIMKVRERNQKRGCYT